VAIDPRSTRAPYQSAPRGEGTAEGGLGPVAGATGAEMSRNRFGGPVRTESRTATLTTAVAPILGNNPRRVFWSIINRGVVNAAVDVDSAMTFADGILLGAAGGFAQMDVEEDGETVGWTVYGAAESATAVVRIVETMRV
jgi:hypothetical protein